MTDILIGLVLLGAIVGIVWVVTHHKPPTTPSGKDLANTLSADSLDIWDAIKRDMPQIVSAEVAKLKADLATALQRAQAAEKALAEAQASHAASLAAVAARVVTAITSSPELPPSAVSPEAAAVQMADTAKVQALANDLTDG